jgi:hypothetical protein
MRGPTSRHSKWQLLTLSLTILLLASVIVLGYQLNSASRGLSRSDGQLPLLKRFPHTIVPDSHLLIVLLPAAAYAVETAAGLVLVDTGLDADTASLTQRLKVLGLKSQQRWEAVLGGGILEMGYLLDRKEVDGVKCLDSSGRLVPVGQLLALLKWHERIIWHRHAGLPSSRLGSGE